MSKHLTSGKAREILHHGTVRGHKLTKKQRGLFGAVAGGKSFKVHNSPAKIGIDRQVEYVQAPK
ncbi:MAG: hypothetical protein ACREUY_09665 [Burkholderiales bacterium]